MKQKTIFLIGILSVFILMQPAWRIAGISVKTWMVWLAAAAGGILWLCEKKNGGARHTTLIYMLGIAMLWNVLRIIRDAVTRKGCEEWSLLAVALLMLFYLVYVQIGYKPVYTYTLLLCAAILYVGLLWSFLVNPSYTVNLQPLLEDKQALSALILLVNVAAAEMYCMEEEGTKRMFCLMMAAFGYLLLFLVKNTIGMALMGVCFPVSILAHRPERKYIQRIMQLLFLFFFMMSNMCLLTNYTVLVKTEVSYSLENSIYLDLVIAIVGSIFFAWWDKLPRNGGEIQQTESRGDRRHPSPKEKDPYERFRRMTGWILAGCGIVFVLLLLPGRSAADAELSGSAALIRQLSEELQRTVQEQGGFFWDVVKHCGIAGTIWLICMGILVTKRMAGLIRQKKAEPETVVFFFLFLLQSLFYRQQPVSTPVYLIFTAMALHGRPEREQLKKTPEPKNAGTVRKGRKRRENSRGKQTEEDDMEIWDMESFFPDSGDDDTLYGSREDTGSPDAGEYYQRNTDAGCDQGKRAKRSGRLR